MPALVSWYSTTETRLDLILQGTSGCKTMVHVCSMNSLDSIAEYIAPTIH